MTNTIDPVLEQFQQDVNGAKRLLHYALSDGWQPADEGDDIDDVTIQAIEDAVDKAQSTQGVNATDRANFEKAYRDLCRKVAPVTADTLYMTSEDSAKTTVLTPFQGVSRAGRWSRMLMIYTGVFATAILYHEYLNVVIGQFAPPDDEPMPWNSIVTWYTVLSILVPFLYGGLGACVFILKSCHVFIHERTFDKRRISEYLNRILLGLVSGGVITLFVSEVGGNGDEVVRLSAAALGFLAGYNTDFLFQTLERVAQALFPKIGISSLQKAPPVKKSLNKEASALVTDLLARYEKAPDQATKDMLADILKKAKEAL